jgi:hypothetical protein
MSSIESEVIQMRTSLNQWKSDPSRYKPQLNNVEHGANIIRTDLEVLLRTLEAAMKEEVKLEADPAAAGEGFKVGDLLYTSWGYDQTNIDFYQVVQVKGRATVVIRQVAEKIVRQGDQEEDVVPEPGKFEGEPLLRRVKPGDRPSVKLESYAWAYLWDGKPKRQTHGG